MPKLKLPKAIWSVPGDVMVNSLGDGKTDRLGEFDPEARVIEVKDTLSAEMQLLVLWHEIVHLALYDSGAVNTLKGRSGARKKEEAVCDAIAQHLVGMTRAGQLTLRTLRKP